MCEKRVYNKSVRPYFKLLRLPYQFQLGPLFLWGFWLGGGSFDSWYEFGRFAAVFLIFHVGAFGGLTALNSFYDRDEGPIGGMWNPPRVPPFLWEFAWLVQLGGLCALLVFGANLVWAYCALLFLSLLYSHPATRWKGLPWHSLAIVTVGQGVLDCLAGAFAASSTRLNDVFVAGLLGATILVAAFYPLTQLYQAADDRKRGDQTLATWLLDRGGRDYVFAWSMSLLLLGAIYNAFALWRKMLHVDGSLLLLATALPLWFLWTWRNEDEPSVENDFRRVHKFMRAMALAFATYVFARLLWPLLQTWLR